MNFYFLYPKFLYLLLLIPILLILFFLSTSYNKKKAILFSNFEALERISGLEFFSKNFFVLFLDIFLLILLVLSMAQLHVSYMADTDSFSHVILLDSSRGMNVDDLGESRLSMAKRAAKTFVDSLPANVEFGVVSFAGESRIIKRIDPSRVHTISSIDSVSEIEVDGTNILNAIILADSLFSSGQKKAILLVSDGEYSVGNLSEILKYVLDNDILVNTIAVGTSEGARDFSGALHKKDLDFMRALSFNSGGKFFEINSSRIPDNFGEVFVKSRREVNLDLTFYLLALALLVFLLNWFIINFRINFLP